MEGCNIVVLFQLSVGIFDVPPTKYGRIYLRSVGVFYKINVRRTE